VAWSACSHLGKIGPHFIGHIDHRAQEVLPINPGFGIIFTPTCAKEFVKQYSDSNHYVYLDRGNPISQRFAQKRNISDHGQITGHVVDMLVQAAIYAGHKKIVLIGVDLSFKTRKSLEEYSAKRNLVPEVIESVNYRGEPVYLNTVFDICRQGLQEHARRWPEIEFTVGSDQGVILDGIPFEPQA
jgi:hypothetical protein